ncbi:MAG: hypothetical protein EOO01_28405 [Chitinophagaceae bacterium]|nr:MAG: hypothetical protein EOO01_28405 [Chitinophagaceae bacterium]
MESNYVISRLKSTRYKYATAQVLQERIQNMDYFQRMQLLANLKTELWRESNIDIYEPLCLVIQRRKSAA